MKVLLDENVPETITMAFDRFETSHVNELGWQGKQNGELLAAAHFTSLETSAHQVLQSQIVLLS